MTSTTRGYAVVTMLEAYYRALCYTKLCLDCIARWHRSGTCNVGEARLAESAAVGKLAG